MSQKIYPLVNILEKSAVLRRLASVSACHVWIGVSGAVPILVYLLRVRSNRILKYEYKSTLGGRPCHVLPSSLPEIKTVAKAKVAITSYNCIYC